MPSNVTEHYQLNQWEATDQVCRTDFNADNAKIDAALAQKCEIITGTYVGDNAAQRNIYLGRKPKAVFLCLREGFTYSSGQNYGGLAFPSAPAYRNTPDQPVLTVTDTGFTVYYKSSPNIRTNSNGDLYHYIAFC